MTPVVSESMMKRDCPFRGSSAWGSVTADTTRASASTALVMYIFRPEMSQSSPSCTASVWMAFTSDPAVGSVLQKEMILSPRAAGPTHLPWIMSLPHR